MPKHLDIASLKKTKIIIKTKIEETKSIFKQRPEQAGLLVTAELNKALEDCKARVSRIAKDCRAKNRKFRDIEFDLENDRFRCLQCLSYDSDEQYEPADVQRVTQIFDKPQFFIDGADSNDIVQGSLGDCWFLSALATMSTAPGLVEKFCVAKDEEVGVYGFIFFRDTAWVIVIIDDLLFTAIPKFEELSATEKALYHNDKEKYNKTARMGGKSLYFARSGTPSETWVPLIEKAYAKLHGDYQSLSGGYCAEAIEDLTGGVSSSVQSKDILDPERFWKEELLNANKDRLFGCAFNSLDPSRSGQTDITINGLYGGHAYSVLRAVEHRGKKFVVVRNPWGKSEWTGAWSDGSKEWNAEWINALPAIGHVFGDDGQFVMEYGDFLENFEQIDRTRLFDSTWAMSSQWLEVPARCLPTAWSYGDVSFTITLQNPSSAVIVLSLLDDRYFKDINGRTRWSFDFLLYKKGDTQLLAEASSPRALARSTNLEIDLEAGEYVIHVRLDPKHTREEGYFENASKNWDERKLSRVLTERAKSQSIASNFRKDVQANNLPVPLEELAGVDLKEKREAEIAATQSDPVEEPAAEEDKNIANAETDAGAEPTSVSASNVTVTKTITTRKVVIVTSSDGENRTVTQKGQTTTSSVDAQTEAALPIQDDDDDEDYEDVDDENDDDTSDNDKDNGAEDASEPMNNVPTHEPVVDIWSSSESLFLGLRVYTHKDAVAAVDGQLKVAQAELKNN